MLKKKKSYTLRNQKKKNVGSEKLPPLMQFIINQDLVYFFPSRYIYVYGEGQEKELKEEEAEDKDILDIQAIIFRNKNNLGSHNLIIPVSSPCSPPKGKMSKDPLLYF